MGVGKVDSCGAHLVELLTGTWSGVGKVDDVHDLGAAEAGDLHSTHTGQARASCATHVCACRPAELLVGGGIVSESASVA